MARVYSNYSDEEIAILQEESKKLGLSLSAYQKYRTLLSLKQKEGTDITNLIAEMKESLANKRAGDVFIVSSLLPDKWVELNKREKNTLAQVLKRIVSENPQRYGKNAVLPGKINQYIVK